MCVHSDLLKLAQQCLLNFWFRESGSVVKVPCENWKDYSSDPTLCLARLRSQSYEESPIDLRVK